MEWPDRGTVPPHRKTGPDRESPAQLTPQPNNSLYQPTKTLFPPVYNRSMQTFVSKENLSLKSVKRSDEIFFFNLLKMVVLLDSPLTVTKQIFSRK
ncbi:hypothetical protein ACH3XW_9825 [Acanthocheilonema viteae]